MPGTHARDRSVEQVPFTKRLIHPEAALTLKDFEQFVYASTTGAAFSITVPRPEQVAGRIIAIFMVARSSSDDITVVTEGLSDIVLNAAGEYTILMSIGKDYVEIASNHS